MHIKIGNPWTWWKESYNVRYGIGLVITVILMLVHFGLILFFIGMVVLAIMTGS